MCVSGCIDDCRLDCCPKIRAFKPLAAFICDVCGELNGAEYYETPENKKICSTCADTMTVQEALVFLGCLVVWN